MYSKRTTILARALALSFAGALAAAPLTMPVRIYAETSASDLQSQLETAKKELLVLQKKMDQADAELGKTTYDLEQTQSKISELEDTISQNKEKLAAAQEELGKQVSVTYKRGNGKLLSVILGSDGFDDLVSRMFYANKVAESEQQAISDVRELQQQLESDKAALKEQEASQKELVASKTAEQQASEQAAAAQADYVNQLSDEVRAALEEQRRREAEESLRLAQEAQRKQEEAQQQQQQQQQQQEQQSQNQNQNQESPQPDQSAGEQPSAPSTGGSSSASSSQRQAAVNAGLSQVGKPYGHSNNGSNWDCNGLTHYAWAQAGVNIPAASGHYGYGQFQWMKNSGRWVTSVSALQPGDLVFYSYDGGRTTYHVALYIGGGQVVHANGYVYGVHVSSVNFDYGFCGGGSPL